MIVPLIKCAIESVKQAWNSLAIAKWFEDVIKSTILVLLQFS